CSLPYRARAAHTVPRGRARCSDRHARASTIRGPAKPVDSDGKTMSRPPQNGQHAPGPLPDGAAGRRFVVGISGASGAAYALRTLELLLSAGAEVHLVVTDYGRRLLFDECRVTHVEFASLCPGVADARAAGRLVIHPNKDVGAVIASGSFRHDGMVVIPCSSTTLGAIATGSGSNLLTRAAMVTLKERRTLVVCHRETPLSLIDIENMRQLTLAGGIVCPAS